jgi:hypothetical protein
MAKLKELTRLALCAALGLAALALGFASPAAAATYVKFYNGGTGYTGDFSGANMYAQTKGLATNCATGNVCNSGDVLSTTNGTLSFTGFGNTITAGVNNATNNKVWDDLTPNFGGMGVGTGSPSDTDFISGSDVLTLTFNTKVTLLGVATLFDPAHSPFGPGDPLSSSTGKFLLSVDGGGWISVLFSDANNSALSYTGTSFSFSEKSSDPAFYVSALEYQATPIPGALPLFIGGLGTVGLLLRRRKQKTALAA